MKENESQAQQPRQRTKPLQSVNGVFMMRGKGQSIEEFVKVCIRRLREAGLIND